MVLNRAKRLICPIYHCFTENIEEASLQAKQLKFFDKIFLRYHTEEAKKILTEETEIFFPNFLPS